MSKIVIIQMKDIEKMSTELSVVPEGIESTKKAIILVCDSVASIATELNAMFNSTMESLRSSRKSISIPKMEQFNPFYDEGESYRPRFGIQGLLYRYDPKAKHSEKKVMKGHINIVTTRKQFMQLKTFKNLRFERKR